MYLSILISGETNTLLTELMDLRVRFRILLSIPESPSKQGLCTRGMWDSIP